MGWGGGTPFFILFPENTYGNLLFCKRTIYLTYNLTILSMINFISSLIPNVEYPDLHYTGNEKQLKQVINKQSAGAWEMTVKKYITHHYIDVTLF
jgi:hypothetical protein